MILSTESFKSFWDPTRLDMFQFWRWLLAVVCAIYALVVTAHSLAGWMAYLSRPERTRVFLKNYVVVQLLRLRVLRFWRELVQIAFWMAAFVLLVQLHHHLG